LIHIASRNFNNNVKIEAIHGGIREELFLESGPATFPDVPTLLDGYGHSFHYERTAAALNNKSPVQRKTEPGF